MTDNAEAFPTLDDADLAVFDRLGTRRSIAAGEFLYREGDATYDFYVVVAGAVEILVPVDGEERIITRYTAGGFLGELNLLTGMRVFVSARVVEPGEGRCGVVQSGVGRMWVGVAESVQMTLASSSNAAATRSSRLRALTPSS
jgi:CRP-like cAMP-binding protein